MENKTILHRPVLCLHQFQQPHLQPPSPTLQQQLIQPPPLQQLPQSQEIISHSQQATLLLNSAVTYSTLQQPAVATHHFALPHIALHQIDGVSTIISSPTQLSLQQQRVMSQEDTINLTSENIAQLMSPNNLTNLGNIIGEKVAIYRHPLFPLLRILFEKCDLATNTIETVSSTAFDHEIKTFITQMAKENKPFFTDDAEVDSLMLKSLQVLRIHLLELEKVNELCKDFCTRYISCLKGKLNSENIMKTLDIPNTPPPSPLPKNNEEPMDYVANVSKNNEKTVCAANSTHLEQLSRSASLSYIPSTSQPTEENVSTVTRSLSIDSVIDTTKSKNEIIIPDTSNISDIGSEFLRKTNKCSKRGVLPKSATNIMKAWLFQHLVHPYPTEDEKKELANQCNLSNLQVNNWFINARRRILQPMLYTSNNFLKNNKKSKQQRNAAHKDWTNSIGVYNAYRTEALQAQRTAATRENSSSEQQQTNQESPPPQQEQSQQQAMLSMQQSHQLPQHIRFLVDHRQQPLLVNIADGQSHPVVLNKPIQFVQVSQIPLQPMPQSYLSMVTAISTQVPVLMTSQQPTVMSASGKPSTIHPTTNNSTTSN